MTKKVPFIPTVNCSGVCSIAKKETDICCLSGRECCFTCLDEECPLKEKYKAIIEQAMKNLPNAC